jgi:hypothetical protein
MDVMIGILSEIRDGISKGDLNYSNNTKEKEVRITGTGAFGVW